MMMKSLADAVNHSKLKTQIAEEVESERSAAIGKESSSEDLYSNDGGAGYEMPQIDPD